MCYVKKIKRHTTTNRLIKSFMKKFTLLFMLLLSMVSPALAVEFAKSNPTQGGEYYVLNVANDEWLGGLAGTILDKNRRPELWQVSVVEGGYTIKNSSNKYISITDKYEKQTLSKKYKTTVTASDNAGTACTVQLNEKENNAWTIKVPNLYPVAKDLTAEPARDVTYFFNISKTLIGTWSAEAQTTDEGAEWIFITVDDYNDVMQKSPVITNNIGGETTKLLLGTVKQKAFTITPTEAATITTNPEGIISLENGTLTTLAAGTTTLNISMAEGTYNNVFYTAKDTSFVFVVVDLVTFENAIKAGKNKLAEYNANRGYLAGMYNPADIAPLAQAVAEAEALYADIEKDFENNYNEDAINAAISAMESINCVVNENEINAIATTEAELKNGEKLTLTNAPLQGNTLYRLSTDYTGEEMNINLIDPDGKSIVNVDSENQSLSEDENAPKHYEYVFYTSSTGDYTIEFTAKDSINYSNMTLFTLRTESDDMKGSDITAVESSKEFFIYNNATGLFLNENNSCDNTMPTLWTATRNTENNTWTIARGEKNINVALTIPNNKVTVPVLNIEVGGYSSNEPDTVIINTDAAEASTLTISGSADSYLISNVANWKYFNFEELLQKPLSVGQLIKDGGYPTSYTSYIYAGTPEEGASKVLATEYPSLISARWKFITAEDYEQTKEYREKVIAALNSKLEEAKQTIEDAENTTARKTAAKAMIAKADAMSKLLASSLIGGIYKPATSEIIKAIDEVEQAMEYVQVNRIYYAACKEAIQNMSRLSSGTFVSGIVSAANTGLEACLKTETMDLVMLSLRAAATLYAQTIYTWEEGQDFTGFIGNNAFSTEDTSKWFTLNMTDIANSVPAIKDILDKLSAIGIQPSEKKATVEDGQLSASSSMYQALVGIPEGTYRLSAQMATGKLNNAFLQAIVVDGSTIIDAIKDLANITDFSWEDAAKLAQAIINREPIADIIDKVGSTINIDKDQLTDLIMGAMTGENGVINTNAVAGKGIDEMIDHSLEFEVKGKAIVIIGASAQTRLTDIAGDMLDGIEAIIGSAEYKADNFSLVYIENPPRKIEHSVTISNDVKPENAPELGGQTFTTFVAPFDVNISDLGNCEVYAITSIDTEDGETLILERVNEVIPANKPVVLLRDTDAADAIIKGMNWPIENDSTSNGLLSGTFAGTTISDGYVLDYGTEGLAFYRITEPQKIDPNKCYISPIEGVEKNVLRIKIEDYFTPIPTGIQSAEAAENNAPIYNTFGQRVGKNAKGLVILNGRKYFKK